MQRIAYLLFILLVAVHPASAQSNSEKVSVQLDAIVQTSPARITLSWTSLPSTSSISIYRKVTTDDSWGNALAYPSSSSTQYIDNAVTIGAAYEYKVVRSAGGKTGQGYICSGIKVPMTEYRGKIILLVDNTFSSSLSTELAQLQEDLRADGWAVVRSDVSRTASVSSVKSVVAGHYNSDPNNVKALYIIGHVPVPYSGNINPDGHSEHLGAWPCDGYYGDIDGVWTDNTVNSNGAQRIQNKNVPGDGKFDQSNFPSEVELQVGRLDMYDMPAFSENETELLRSYLNKVHQYKINQWAPLDRGIIFDNFQYLSDPLGASGWRNITPLVGADQITIANPYAYEFSSLINGESYLWTYACGGGLQQTVDGVLTYNGASNVGTTSDYTEQPCNGAFNMSFGSYFGDWDNKNNFLRAPLASGDGLTNCWAAIPAWYMQHMAMGVNIGYSTKLTMNNSSLYTPLTDGWQPTMGRTHLALMGDPSLRQKMIPMPSGLTISDAGGYPAFSWNAASGGVDGYHLYRFETSGAITRLTTDPVTSNTYLNYAIPYIPGAQYMVRAVKLIVGSSGSYKDLSLGAIATASGSLQIDCNGVAGGPTLPGTSCDDGMASTSGDHWDATCTCVGQNSGTGCAGIRTESQNSWGAAPNADNAASYMLSHFAEAFSSPNYLKIGSAARQWKLNSGSSVTAFLSSIGPSSVLALGTVLNPGHSYGNTLAGQLVALKLSVAFDQLDPDFSASDVLLKDMIIQSGPAAGRSVHQLIRIADQYLGGKASLASYRDDIRDALASVNQGYMAGQMDSGYLGCQGIAPGMMLETGIPDDQDAMTEDLDVLVYPDPVAGDATFQITGAVQGEPITVEVYAMTGMLVDRLLEDPGMAGDHRIRWNASALTSGMYFYRVMSGARLTSGKLVVE